MRRSIHQGKARLDNLGLSDQLRDALWVVDHGSAASSLHIHCFSPSAATKSWKNEKLTGAMLTLEEWKVCRCLFTEVTAADSLLPYVWTSSEGEYSSSEHYFPTDKPLGMVSSVKWLLFLSLSPLPLHSLPLFDWDGLSFHSYCKVWTWKLKNAAQIMATDVCHFLV